MRKFLIVLLSCLFFFVGGRAAAADAGFKLAAPAV